MTETMMTGEHAAARDCRGASILGGASPIGSVLRAKSYLLAILLAVAAAASAMAQGSGGSFPDPRGGETVAAWLAAIGADASPNSAAWPLHHRYLEQAAALRDGEIEAWLAESREGGTLAVAGDPETTSRRSRERAASQRRLVDRLGQLESAFWNEVAAALAIDAAPLAVLQARGIRERALDLRIRQRLFAAASAPPADLLELLARLDASPEESRSIREVLADHDQRLTDALRAAMDEELERPARLAAAIAASREAAIAEAEAAALEGRAPRAIEADEAFGEADPVMRSLMDGRGARRILEQQLDSLARLQEVVGAPRLDALLLSLRLVPGDGIANLRRREIEPRLRAGEISSAQAAEVESILADHHRERVRLGLELAREQAKLEESMAWGGGADALDRRREETRADRLRDELLGTLPGRTRERLAAVVDLGEENRDRGGRAADLARGDLPVSIEFGEQAITFTAVAVVATTAAIEGGEIDGEIAGEFAGEFAGPIAISFTSEGGPVMLGNAVSSPRLRAMDAARFAAMLADAAPGDAAAATGEIAEQLRRDTAEAFDAILRELEATLAASRPRGDGGPMIAFSLGGGSAAAIEPVDSALRQCLAADATMFDSLEALLGPAAAERLALWREARVVELLSVAAGLREPSGGHSFTPWEGRHPSIDLLELAFTTVPDAMREPAARASAARQLEAIRRGIEGHWVEQRTLRPALEAARDAVFRTPADGAAAIALGAEQMQALSRAEARRADSDRRVRDCVRAAFEQFERSLPPEAARTFHATMRREAWPDAVPSMPALAGMNAAMRVLAADEAAMASLAEIERRYLAESDRLFARLDALSKPSAAERNGPAGFSPRQMQRWESVAGRLRFLHRELDHATVRQLRGLVGPEHASRIEWPDRTAPQGPTISFFGN